MVLGVRKMKIEKLISILKEISAEEGYVSVHSTLRLSAPIVEIGLGDIFTVELKSLKGSILIWDGGTQILEDWEVEDLFPDSELNELARTFLKDLPTTIEGVLEIIVEWVEKHGKVFKVAPRWIERPVPLNQYKLRGRKDSNLLERIEKVLRK